MTNLEIDILITNKVMGLDKEPWEPFFPSVDISHAWKVVEKINQFGDFTLYKDCDSSKWIAELALSTVEIYSASDETVPMTICKLALNTFNK